MADYLPRFEITSCITDEQLVMMLDGALPPECVEALVAHVDTCLECIELVAELGVFDVTRVVVAGAWTRRRHGRLGATRQWK